MRCCSCYLGKTEKGFGYVARSPKLEKRRCSVNFGQWGSVKSRELDRVRVPATLQRLQHQPDRNVRLHLTAPFAAVTVKCRKVGLPPLSGEVRCREAQFGRRGWAGISWRVLLVARGRSLGIPQPFGHPPRRLSRVTGRGAKGGGGGVTHWGVHEQLVVDVRSAVFSTLLGVLASIILIP